MDIAVERINEIIVRLRAFEAKEGPTDPDSGSNAIDDGATDVLTSGTDDLTEAETHGLIRSLNDDERAELLALLYLGRGDMEAQEWDEAVRFAREREAAGDGALKEILGTPDAAGLLEAGLDSLDGTADAPDA